MTLGIAGLWLVSVVLIWIGREYLLRPERIRRLFLWALHLMYGDRIPAGFWTPVAGGIAFIVCGVLAFGIGTGTLIQNLSP
jgi:hypothetical protein